ncbi:acyl-CoA thioester hydrolase [Lutibacter sp. Hel_I_33_5]|uniref:acyl-CoA thioesterase n=1 Tax=Lutibacter sp. Hel_I_33_5 TaxID=1566289 RepID=UPI0011AA5130|nr:thioesterase family protein [Lutibacter sp. Hel_I_33_5]TVZ55196.1 acyl-CoA thioester hydrolase [Lutibacter sp. Hel_I_33_5]
MLEHNSSFRVRYGETDQMGVVYHGNYAQYFELGRTELLRSLGITYKDMELGGIMLPVISLNFQFKKSSFYDEILTIKTILKKKPGVKIEFDVEIKNEKQEIVTTGNAVLVFMDMKKKKPMRCPDYLLEKLNF